MANLPPAKKPRSLGLSTLFPVLTDRKELRSKIHVLPILAVIVAVSALTFAGHIPFLPVATDEFTGYADIDETVQSCWILALLIAFLVNYYVYMLCGRDKPWWLLGAVFVIMILVFTDSPLNDLVVAWNRWADPLHGTPMHKVLASYYGPGVGEEIAKVLPVFFLVWVGRWKTPFARRIGVSEPLDGILIAVVSATAFALPETLDDYIYKAMRFILGVVVENLCHDNKTNECVQSAIAVGLGHARYQALLNLLMRTLPTLTGHLAYSGVFGYFIGLAVIRPAYKWRLLLTGWLCAMALHGSWDAMGFAYPSLILSVLIPVVSYVFLAAAIVKARKLSPTRSYNFATVVGAPAGAGASYRAPQPPPPVAPPPPPDPAAAIIKPVPAPTAALVLKIGTVTRAVVTGTTIEPMHLGIAGAGRGTGPIAEIVANPKDASVLGLRNLSDRIYRATMPSGKMFEISRGETARLEQGVVIDFGGVEGTVQPA